MNIIQYPAYTKFTEYDSNLIVKYKDKSTTEFKKLSSSYSRFGDIFPLDSVIGNYQSKTISLTECTATDAYNYIKQKPVIFTPTTKTISSGNKISFADSTFPSLLLGRLNIGIKRTTNHDVADIIVSDCTMNTHDCFDTPVLLDEVNKVAIPMQIWWSEDIKSYIARANIVQQKLKEVYNYKFKFYCTVKTSNIDLYNVAQKHSSKIISTRAFTTYVISKLPQLGQTEASNICDMLKAKDPDIVSMALGMLQYHNFYEYGPEILTALGTSLCVDLPTNRDALYIYKLLNVTKNQLHDFHHYGIKNKIDFIMNSLNNFVVAPSMTVKEKVYTVLRSDLFNKIVEEYDDSFKRLKVTLQLTPYDENGTADTSSQKVEGA